MKMKHLPAIRVEAIHHENHRYETVGDYWKEKQWWNFRVSKMSSSDYEFLVILHEMVEWYLTQREGISEPVIARFDKMFEKERAQGRWKDEEPGNDPRAPYREQHRFATKVEKLVAKEMGINWREYDNEVNSL